MNASKPIAVLDDLALIQEKVDAVTSLYRDAYEISYAERRLALGHLISKSVRSRADRDATARRVLGVRAHAARRRSRRSSPTTALVGIRVEVGLIGT